MGDYPFTVCARIARLPEWPLPLSPKKLVPMPAPRSIAVFVGKAAASGAISFATGRILAVVTSLSTYWVVTISVVVFLAALAILLIGWPKINDGRRGPVGRTFARTKGGSLTMRGGSVKNKSTDLDQEGTDTDIRDSTFE